jgi:putative photosynthetic complex assembly protein 2
MIEYLLPIGVALLIWWLGTGIVMLLDSAPRDSFRWSVAISTLLAAAALVCVARSADNIAAEGAYAAFTCAVVIWGWHELTFLTGWLTGPRRVPCSAPARRFGEAVAAILWHEIAIAAMAALIIALTWDAPNQVATWTFLLLWLMRLSAKLNLFLGVRNLGEQFLPPHLTYMRSYFRRRSMNLLFPIVVTASTAIAGWLVVQAIGAEGADRTALLLVSTLLWLAVIEHWLLVLPLESTALWRWAMRRGEEAANKSAAVRVTLNTKAAP